MKIEDYITDEDGQIIFLVPSNDYERVLQQLKAKGVPAEGSHTNTDFSEINIHVGTSIDTVNEALSDLR